MNSPKRRRNSKIGQHAVRRRPSFEQLEYRRVLASVSVEPFFKTFEISGSGEFVGSGPDDSFQGQASFSGQITYSSPTEGIGTAEGSGSGSGNDGCRPYAFQFEGSATISDIDGDLSHINPQETDFRYTQVPCGGGIGGSLYRSDFIGNFDTSNFEADLSSASQGYSATWTGGVNFSGGRPDGRFSEAKFGRSGLTYEFVIAGGAANVESHSTPVSEVSAYWSSGTDRLGEAHTAIDVYWNQRSGSVTVTELDMPPAQATGVLLVFDPGGSLDEGSAGEENNTHFVPFFSLERVEALYDDLDGTDLALGGYLQGVQLEQEWKLHFAGIEPDALAKVQISGPAIQTMELQLEGTAWKTPNMIDMGLFTEDSEIQVQATSNSGIVVNDTFSIKLYDGKFDLEVEVEVGESQVAVEDIRVIDELAFPAGFHINIPLAGMDLPLKEDNDPYRNKLDVILMADGDETAFRKSLFANSEVLLQSLNDLPTGELKLVLKAANGEARKFRTQDIELSDTETLLKIALPEWMGTPVAAEYEATSHNYRLDLVLPKQIQATFPDTNADFGFFSGLESSITAGAYIAVVAPLVAPENSTASIEFQRLVAESTLLGQTLLNQTLSASELDVNTSNSTLAARHFDGGTIVVEQGQENGINIRDARSSSGKLFDVGFGSKGDDDQDKLDWEMSSESINQIKNLTDVDFTPSLSFSGDFDSSLDTARLKYKLTFDAENAKILPDSSFIGLSATGRASASLSIGAGIDILGFTFFSATGTASVGASLSVTAEAKLGGSLLAPTIDTLTAKGRGTLWSEFAYSVEVLENTVVDDAVPLGNTEFSLFDVSAEFAPHAFENGAEFDLLQRSRTTTAFGSVSPSQGSTFSLLDASAGQTSGNARLRFSQPIFGQIEGLTYDAQVLANTAELTPNRHFLEVVLSDSEIVLDRVDLATIELTPADTPLGFASGWRARHGISPTSLDPTKPQQLEFRLLTESGDETVALGLDNLQLEKIEASILATSPVDPITDGRLDFVDTSTEIDLSALGNARSRIHSLTLSGSQFILSDATQSTLFLYPDDAPSPVAFQVIDPTQDAFAILTIKSDDPKQPRREIELVRNVDGTRYDQHNYRNRLDVDNDTFVAPRDVLIIVNFLNARPDSPQLRDSGEPYLDVNRDNSVAPVDALIIINELNARAAAEGESTAPPRKPVVPQQFVSWNDLPKMQETTDVSVRYSMGPTSDFSSHRNLRTGDILPLNATRSAKQTSWRSESNLLPLLRPKEGSADSDSTDLHASAVDTAITLLFTERQVSVD